MARAVVGHITSLFCLPLKPMAHGQKSKVRPKKYLGQHFLHDRNTAARIVNSLDVPAGHPVRLLEIGPGMGVLTRFLLEREEVDLKVVEIDGESVAYLKRELAMPASRIIEGDFLKLDLNGVFDGSFSVIGNFPYNISSQIFFHLLDYRDQVEQVVCMLQKEVAERIASRPGNKIYGILSVLLQAWYDVDYLFSVSPGVFTPPPKVVSAVIRLRRNSRRQLPCDERLFVQVVRQGFNNRRKTLRNALKNLNLVGAVSALSLLDKRAEQLSVEDFFQLTTIIEESRGASGT
jgi:16S rRNA (adenine1518-N6/adenine1519-N6)-dimethyltransferase